MILACQQSTDDSATAAQIGEGDQSAVIRHGLQPPERWYRV